MRLHTCLLVSLVAFLQPVLLPAQSKIAPPKAYHLLIGTYTGGKSEGIYVYKFDVGTGEGVYESKAALPNPSFLALSANQKYVYAVEEEQDAPKVDAFKFNATTGQLTFLNSQPTGGAHPCYVSTDKKGKKVFVGNYTGGSLSANALLPDGSLSKSRQMIAHTGSGADKERQGSPHVHATTLSPDNDYLLVPDLGLDKVMVYPVSVDNVESSLEQEYATWAKIEDGGGPRHVAFHPNGKYVYLVHEMTAKVSLFSFEVGKLKALQTIEMNAPEFKGANGAADIHASPDGKFLYASNRGDANELVIYAINQTDGTLTLVGRQSTLGKTPRNFVIDPTGTYLLVANQGSDYIVVFKRDTTTGLLTDTGKKIEVGKPVCLVFAEVK